MHVLYLIKNLINININIEVFINYFYTQINKKKLKSSKIRKLIRLNLFLIALCIFLTRKFNKKIRFYIIYRIFNIIIIKIKYTLLLI